MIVLKQIGLQFAQKTLFDDLQLTIHPLQKIGLVGANGAGKSTLFRLIERKIKEDRGEVWIPPQWQISHLEQDVPALSISAMDYVLSGDVQREALYEALALAEAEDDGLKIGEIHGLLHEIDAYTAHVRAAQLLDGLGFSPESIHDPVSTFSGGWRVRLNLARILMSRADLLLLDEPTNHLDLEAIIWLEAWLKQYQGSLLIISHDRDFLDNTVDSIAHLFQYHLKMYTGNYEAFERQRAEQLLLQQKNVDKVAQKRAHLQQFVDRFRAKATKAKQAQSRMKALEKLPMIQAARIESPFSFEIAAPAKQPNPLMQLQTVDLGYGKTPLLSDIELNLGPGARIGLLGLNGVGKSSLIKVLADEIQPMRGVRMIHPDTKIGYFAQHQLDHLRVDCSPLWHLQQLSPNTREQFLRDYLGRFNFRGEEALSPVGTFSGGEKSRLALALLIFQEPNLLLLDEPTNHLDLEMRDALTEALQLYEGAMVIVSHDRHLLESVCDEFYLVEKGVVRFFSSELQDYFIWRQQEKTQKTREKSKLNAPKKIVLAQAELKALRMEIKTIEKRLEQAEIARQKNEHLLADADLYTPDKATALKALQEKQQTILAGIEADEVVWLKLSEQLSG